MAGTLFGVETEYSVTGTTPGGAMEREEILRSLLERARSQLVQLPDLHPTGGVFLRNGSRFYVDCGLHPEVCTPECANPWDAVRYIQAGHSILTRLASSVEAESGPGTEIMAFRCNVDYSGSRSTWGCHESYIHRTSQAALQAQIVPHLVTRLIYTGAGGFNPLSQGLEFSLSPRMAYFRRVDTDSSTSGRGIWHSKSEPLCTGYRRLHILCGENLCSETATFLKVGATALIVAMADASLAPANGIQLANPLAALQAVAGDITCKKPLALVDGSSMTAIEIQRHYLELAEAHLGDGFMPAWAAEVCLRWRQVLNQLEDAPGSVDQALDWGIKLALYASHARRLGLRWKELPFLNKVVEQVAAAISPGDNPENPVSIEHAIGANHPMPKEVAAIEPLLKSQGCEWEDLRTVLGSRKEFFEIDTRFGQLGPKGIFQSLDLAGVLNHQITGVDNIEQAMEEPPADGRAQVRGQVIQRLAGTGHAQCDWRCIVNFDEGKILDLSDPFIREEGSWHPLTRAETHEGGVLYNLAEVIEFDGDSRDAGERGPYSRRQDAADRILSGDFAGAEALLRGLIEERFILPSTHCHMARVLLMTDREPEAREQIGMAWAIREEADSYVVPRILFFRCVFAMFDGAEIAGIIGQLRAALCDPGAHLDWTILPMLDHLREGSRLSAADYEFLKALAEVLSGSEAMEHLEEFPQWRSAAMPQGGTDVGD
jgi:proteasome accessory factor A